MKVYLDLINVVETALQKGERSGMDTHKIKTFTEESAIEHCPTLKAVDEEPFYPWTAHCIQMGPSAKKT